MSLVCVCRGKEEEMEYRTPSEGEYLMQSLYKSSHKPRGASCKKTRFVSKTTQLERRII